MDPSRLSDLSASVVPSAFEEDTRAAPINDRLDEHQMNDLVNSCDLDEMHGFRQGDVENGCDGVDAGEEDTPQRLRALRAPPGSLQGYPYSAALASPQSPPPGVLLRGNRVPATGASGTAGEHYARHNNPYYHDHHPMDLLGAAAAYR